MLVNMCLLSIVTVVKVNYAGQDIREDWKKEAKIMKRKKVEVKEGEGTIKVLKKKRNRVGWERRRGGRRNYKQDNFKSPPYLKYSEVYED